VSTSALAQPPEPILDSEPSDQPPSGHDPRRLGRLIRNLSFLSGSQVVTWSLALVWTVVVPRALGPLGMALLVLNWSAGGVLTAAAGLGTKTLLVREIAADPERAARLIGSTMYLRLFSVAPAFVLIAVYMSLGSFSQLQTAALILAFVATLVTLATEPLQAAFQGMERMQYLALGDILNKILGTVGAVMLVISGFHALAIIILQLCIGLLLLVTYWALLRRYVAIDLTFRWREVADLFRKSLTFWVFTLTLSVYMWIDSLLLSLLAPSTQLGLYGTATRLIAALSFAPTIIGAVWLPRLAHTHRNDWSRFWPSARAPLEAVLVIGLPISVGAAIVSGPLIRLLFGEGFGPAAPIFMVLALLVIPIYLNTVAGHVLIASGRQRAWTVVIVGATVLNPLLNLLLIPAFQRSSGSGAMGAAIALVITEFLIAAAGLALVRRALNRATVRRLAKACFATGGMAAIVVVTAPLGVLVQIALGMVVFGIIAVLIQLATEEERRQLRSLVPLRS
jgi:O-antigen/teichoic acid export membrane protein